MLPVKVIYDMQLCLMSVIHNSYYIMQYPNSGVRLKYSYQNVVLLSASLDANFNFSIYACMPLCCYLCFKCVHSIFLNYLHCV